VGFAFRFRVEGGKCKAVRRDGRGELAASSWCDMKRLLADEWCERSADAASRVDETLLAGARLSSGSAPASHFPERPAGATARARQQ
jgi:hypothetical protein